MMNSSFFFYDLETSGFNPRSARIVQFGGQRTDMNLKPVGKPVNVLIKLTPDVLPDPDAVLITGITPQKTLADGMTEAEFLKYFYKEIVQPDTTFLGFNSVRFDDEFMRFLLYRNFYDAYEWQWRDGCSRWDLLDVVRMTRALRPDGIQWSYAPDGKPANRLEYLAQVNKLEHSNAHDALSDVEATIDLGRLLRKKQPDLFQWLFENRGKKAVSQLVEAGKPFVYTTGKYSSQYNHTSVSVLLAQAPNSEVLVYDLRFDPTSFAKMSVDEIIEAMSYSKDPDAVRLPVKTLKYNRCPAVAPLGVIKDTASQERLDLKLTTVSANLEKLENCKVELAEKVLQAMQQQSKERESEQATLIDDPSTVDARLYDGFVDDADKSTMRTIISTPPDKLNKLSNKLHDERLKNLLPLYKARNYPAAMSEGERHAWDEFCHHKLLDGGDSSRLTRYFNRIEELKAGKPNKQQAHLLEDLKSYGESIARADAAA